MTQAWSPLLTSSHLTLSNNNLTATNTAFDASWQSAVGTTFVSTGHVNFEISFTVLTVPNSQIGIGNNLLTSVTDSFVGDDANGVCSNDSGTIYYNNAAQAGTGVSWSQGDRVQVAFSRTFNKIWWQNLTTNSGWNSDILANQDPSTNTGGFTLPAGLNDSPVSAAAGVGNGATTDSFTGYFDPNSWLGTAPAGFGPFDSIDPTSISVCVSP